MVYCFAYGCKIGSNSGKCTFQFPPNTPAKRELRRKWIAVCNRRRQDIESAKNPRLCEEHFSPESFTKLPELARAAGFRLDLKPDAVPDPQRFIRQSVESKTKFSRSLFDPQERTGRKSLAFQKRQNREVSKVVYHLFNLVDHTQM